MEQLRLFQNAAYNSIKSLQVWDAVTNEIETTCVKNNEFTGSKRPCVYQYCGKANTTAVG